MSEDPRKTALKNGLRQLTLAQLLRVRDYPGPMCVDEWNYADGKFCPLAVAVGLDESVKEPTHETVYSILALMGFKINNTRGVPGEFYTVNREYDLRIALYEVIEEARHARTDLSPAG